MSKSIDKEKNVKIERDYYCMDVITGERGLILDIQYIHNRYQFADLSGWQYGIENLVIIP